MPAQIILPATMGVATNYMADDSEHEGLQRIEGDPARKKNTARPKVRDDRAP
jgi:hypothetical protein